MAEIAVNTNYVLIDFENVQPESLQLLTQEHFKVVVFVGASQNSLPFALADSMQQLGCRAKYVKVSANRPNALDFHIAYYLGRLATSEPTARFHVISKDTGYDPLIEHLQSQHVRAWRVSEVAQITGVRPTGNPIVERMVRPIDQSATQAIANPATKSTAGPTDRTAETPVVQTAVRPVVTPKVCPVADPKMSKSTQDRINTIVDRLKQMTKPKTVKTLSSTIRSFFHKAISEREVASLIQGMVSRGYLKLSGTTVAYFLPTAV